MTAAEMAALHALCFTTPRPWSETEIAELLSNRFCFAINAVSGFLMGRVVAGEAELLTIAVDPAARKQGIGTGLMQEFLAQAATRGADSVFLEVADFNTSAQRLYLASGFTETARRRGYYHAPDGTRSDAILMARAI